MAVIDWLRRFLLLDEAGGRRGDAALELPWMHRWHHVPKRSAGPDFRREDYRRARENAREVARTTLGDRLWTRVQLQGYLDEIGRAHV